METNNLSELEKAVEVFPEIKEFIDHVIETGGKDTLKIEEGAFTWDYKREDDKDCFYMMHLTLDRANPSMWIYFKEMQTGTPPFHKPAKSDELLKKLPKIMGTIQKVYDKCFINKEYWF
jgi:hypothetical protein